VSEHEIRSWLMDMDGVLVHEETDTSSTSSTSSHGSKPRRNPGRPTAIAVTRMFPLGSSPSPEITRRRTKKARIPRQSAEDGRWS